MGDKSKHGRGGNNGKDGGKKKRRKNAYSDAISAERMEFLLEQDERSAKPHVTFEHENTSLEEYRNRCNGKTHLPVAPHRIFAAGMFIDEKGTVNLIVDNQDGKDIKIWKKIPGGNATQAAKYEDYLTALLELLKKAKYSARLIGQIMDREKKAKRTIPERTLVLEMVEETQFYPIEFSYGIDGFRYNTQSKKHDLWQVYFFVELVVSPYSESLEKPIQQIAQVKTAKASDVDVTHMRYVVSVGEVLSALGPDTHKLAALMLFEKGAEMYKEKSKDTQYPEARRAYFAMLAELFDANKSPEHVDLIHVEAKKMDDERDDEPAEDLVVIGGDDDDDGPEEGDLFRV